ncbi:TPR-like protein [Aaosphaeria arxii CBS 175.79]|uniref:TPR-like protein n=1 Tax=Aaosphaeria arxii CBS 175.79 TaxID=1450172 RepID=A0A6A5XP56_9PLEO|nr:TPR-like protein [Aaosphaeria arxii CBS 175.79]KAF2015045.1 TPR-like protein [Aaosphaeria arxii CBS 175.79]
MNQSTVQYLLCILIVVAVTLAFIYDQLTKRIPSRLREAGKPKSGFGLIRADKFSAHDEPACAHGIDIIFVHGLGSNPDTTWGPRESNWVNDILPQDIPVELQKDVRIFFYNYDSYWKRDAIQACLQSFAHGLLDNVALVIRKTENEQTRRLLFVGHSYGGLVIKQALVQAKSNPKFVNIFDHAKAAFFLGTPHQGSHFSKWGSFAARFLQLLNSNQALLEEVNFHALPLYYLHDQFVNITGNMQVVNFFEERHTPLIRVWFWQWSEICVSRQSATYSYDNVKSVGLSVDHSGLNKFTMKDENYTLVVANLLDIIKPIILERQHRLYSVPILVAESYVERKSLSASVEEKLEVLHQGAKIPYSVVIYGLGGTGKTQLARKYVEDHINEYNPILWIDARDEDSTRSSFERCAGELQLSWEQKVTSPSNLVDSEAVQAVLRYLRKRKRTDDRWLVVIDNADDATTGIKDIVPEGSQGSVIITSQDSYLAKHMNHESVEVDVMEDSEAKALLLRHVSLEANIASKAVLHYCGEVAMELGYLALAIDLAGAYITEDIADGKDAESALQYYLKYHKRHRDDLLKNEEFRGLLQSKKTVWTVWDTTLERIRDISGDNHADLLLAFLAHFRGTVVQDELFRIGSLELSIVNQTLYGQSIELPSWLGRIFTRKDGEWDDFDYQNGRRRLERYGLLHRTKGRWPGVSMHGLVQWRAKQWAKEHPWERWCLTTVLAVCDQVSQDVANLEFHREIVTHLPTLEEGYLDRLYLGIPSRCYVWNTIADMYFDEGRWNEAEKIHVEAVETCRNELGVNHLATISSMNNLGLIYRKQGRWKEAEELLREVVEARNNKVGINHTGTLPSMSNLAAVFREQGRLEEAEKLFMEVAEVYKRMLGFDHLSTLESLSDLASVYIDQDRLEEAEELLVTVTEAQKRRLGVDHPITLGNMNTLSSAYLKLRRLEEAEKLLVQIAETHKRMLAIDHPKRLDSMNNLGVVYLKQHRFEEAEELFVQVTEVRKKKLGIDHYETLRSTNNLSCAYLDQGRWEEAEKLLVTAMKARNSLDDPETLKSMFNIAFTWKMQGRHVEALRMLRGCIHLSHRVLSISHPDVLYRQETLAEWEEEEQDKEEKEDEKEEKEDKTEEGDVEKEEEEGEDEEQP